MKEHNNDRARTENEIAAALELGTELEIPKRLTARQAVFCREYIIDLNAKQAAIRAGYSEHTATEQASRLLTIVQVQEEIQRLMNLRTERLDITAEYVLNGIVEVIERCKQVRPVLDKQGQPVMAEDEDGELRPVFTFDAANALRGKELLGRYLKLFDEKDHSTQNNTQVTDITINATPEEATRIYKAMIER